MFHGFRTKDLLIDPLPFKDKGAARFPTFNQLSLELKDADLSLGDLEQEAQDLSSEFWAQFRDNTRPPYHLGVSGYSAGQGYRGVRLMWRKRGTKGKNPFVSASTFIGNISDKSLHQIYVNFEKRRLLWQLHYNRALTHRKGLDSFEGFYQLPSYRGQ